MFPIISTDDMRNAARHQIETLERWMRRLVDHVIRDRLNGDTSKLPKKSGYAEAVARAEADPLRYPRPVDALLLDNLIAIVCSGNVEQLFRPALKRAYGGNANTIREALLHIYSARNPLSHANDITRHQFFRVMCYSMDLIESFKNYFEDENMSREYNAPSFIRIWDDRGNSADEGQLASFDGPRRLNFKNTVLRPGETLQVEVSPDESFHHDSYRISWIVNNVGDPETAEGRIFSLTITERHVSISGLTLTATITSDKSWHRHGNHDDHLTLDYSILPPP